MARCGLYIFVALLFITGLATRPAAGLAAHGPADQGLIAPVSLVASTEQVNRGRTIFATACARCHGPNGQGGDGPRLIGTPNGLAGYGTAQKLFEYTSAEMPMDSPGSLKPEDVWDVLAFILDGNGLLPPNTVLGPDNAATIRTTR